MKKRIAILGSTGSIGRSALAVVEAHAAQLDIVALAAGENATDLAEQVARHRPTVVGVGSDAARAALMPLLDGPSPAVAVALARIRDGTGSTRQACAARACPR